jgi:hypothetical protein
MASETSIQPPVAGWDIESLLQPQFWQSMNPTLHVASPHSSNVEVIGLDAASGDILEDRLVGEGYFQAPPLTWDLPLGDMAAAVVRLTEHGFIAPFCFMYDEFWLMFIKLNPVLRRLLGDGYWMLPNFWAWYIDPRSGQSGWKPHRDANHMALFPDRRPKSLSVWLPLTDATTLNGCMYVLPAHLDQTYGTPRDNEWRIEPQDVRALPGPAGSLFAWTQALLHWGSRSSPLASGPRISMSVEFQRGDVPPMYQPLIPPLALLSPDQRLKLICQQVLRYQNMQSTTDQLRRLAQQVVSRVG